MHRLFALIAALVALVVGGLIGIGSVLGQGQSGASPLPVDASVIAQGVAAVPNQELGWRITRATTPPTGELPARSLPGFLLVDSGVLLLSDGEAESQSRLSAGEAEFAQIGARHQEIAIENPVSYYRVDLVPAADVNDAGNDELVFVGQPFASPGGTRDLDLARDVLAPGEEVELALAGQAAPTLLLVTEGTVDLVPADDPSAAPVQLPAGQAAALGGDVVATATGTTGATIVMAFVGPEIPANLAQLARTPTPTPTPEIGSLTVQAFACPVGYEGDQFATDCVEPLADIAFSLTGAQTGATLEGTTGPEGTVAFPNLEADTYTIGGGVPAEFATHVVGCDLVSAEPVQGDPPGATVPLAAGANVTCSWYAVPEDLRGEDEGTIAVTVHLCPATPVDPYAECTQIDASGVAVAGPVSLTADTATAQGASLVWGETGGVPFGTYFLQPGGIAPAGYELANVLGSAGASGNGWTFVVDETNPSAALDVVLVPVGQAQGAPAGEVQGDPDADSDGDFLTNAQEAVLGTDPANPDTDGDGLFDSMEIANDTDPRNADSDGDGFTDNQETVNSANPLDPGSVPETGEPAIDTDGDGLSDGEEAQLGTNAGAADSDGDGLSDFAEVGFEPGSSTGTDPTLWDTDGDGVDDGTEVAAGTDPTDPASA